MAFNRLLLTSNRLSRVFTSNSRLLSSARVSPLSRRRSAVNQTELSNGLRIICEEIASESATIALHLECGSRNESEDNNGLNSLLFNCLLKEKSIERELEKIGANIQTIAGRERSSIIVRCLSRDATHALTLLSRIITNPSFDCLESARNQLLAQMRANDVNNECVVMDQLHAMAYQNTALALPTTGKTESVQTITASDLSEFMATNVCAPRIVLSAVGSLNANEIVKASEPLFSGISRESSSVFPTINCRFTGSDIRIRDDAMPLAHIAIAVENPGWSHPHHVAMNLVSTLIGSWDRSHGGGSDCSSYLALCSAHDNVTHGFRSFSVNYRETGLWGIYVVCERMKQEDMSFHLTYEWKRFCQEITDNELNRAKNTYLTQIMRQNDNSLGITRQIGEQVLSFNRRIGLEETKDRVLALNAKSVRQICSEYIWDRCPVVSAIGPIEQLEDYDIIRSQLYWFRY